MAVKFAKGASNDNVFSIFIKKARDLVIVRVSKSYWCYNCPHKATYNPN